MNIKVNIPISKSKHFYAARRKKEREMWVGGETGGRVDGTQTSRHIGRQVGRQADR
jgi:hypothetical protein